MLSRRSFLFLSGGVVVLAACGGDGDDSTASDTIPESPSAELRPGVVSSDLYVSDEPQRLGFVLLREGAVATGPSARVAMAPAGTESASYVDTVLRDEGLPEGRGVYTVDAVLATAGTWQAALEIDGGDPLAFSFAVKEAPGAPAPGQAAPRAASPTTTETLGVDPLCTQNPPCPLHETSLDTLIGAGRPVAILFATPARCHTAYCGPVLDVLLPLVGEYRDRVDFVHVEIYKDSRSEDRVPTVAAWNLPSEPWLYGVDNDGVIVNRLDGAFDGSEMRALLDALTDSA